jgi:aspartyl/asparaginyl-tRNA synthetase
MRDTSVKKTFNCPVALINYPKDIKAFYMKLNEDNKTVRAMDVLFPKIGEIIGAEARGKRVMNSFYQGSRRMGLILMITGGILN